MCVCYFRLQRTEFEVAGGCHTYLLHLCYNFLSFVLKQKKETKNKETKKKFDYKVNW